MGMFDSVYVEVDLPDFDVEDEAYFQTKELDNLLNEYRVTEDRILLRNGEQTTYTGSFEIHGSLGNYELTFDNGRLTDIAESDRLS